VISKYGVGVVARFLLIASIIILCDYTLIERGLLQSIILVLVGISLVFVLNFFRDPKRILPQGEGLLVAPADGKVILIKDIFDPEFLQQDAKQLSIFMSPLNVHVNRFPLAGTITYFKYFPGKHFVAFNEKSSALNERTHIGIENDGYKVLFKQIAGTVARRIVADITIGQKATAGERFGMIKFGSRVDVILPKQTVIEVKIGEHVRAGESVIARYIKTTERIS